MKSTIVYFGWYWYYLSNLNSERGMTLSKFGLYGKLTAVEGKREELLNILLEAANSMKDVEGCDIYLVNVSNEHPNDVIIYEVWENAEAHQASLSLEVTQTLIQRAKPIIAGMERFHTLQTFGGKGI